MITAKFDDRKRVLIPQGKPGQVVEVRENGDGSITLTPVEAVAKEPFPPGSLLKEVEDMNREWAGVHPIIPVPEDRD